MKNRIFVSRLLSILIFSAVIFSACRKINDATTIGSGLIPPVDNITTFDTSLSVQAFNDTFAFAFDSVALAHTAEFFLGKINNDPFFGKTDARLFIELKPIAYGIYPFQHRDSVRIDSCVLILSYAETYGDTNTAQSVSVYPIYPAPQNNFRFDSAYQIRLENIAYNTGTALQIPGQFFYPRDLKDSVKAYKDTTSAQLRVKLDTALARRFFNYDTSNAYKSDSIFKTLFNGFALRSEGSGNAIMGFNLGSLNTKLAFYYRFPKQDGTGGDSLAVSYFNFTTLSAGANYIKRDWTGTPLQSSLGGTTPDQVLYLQGTPGTFATIKIPDLPNISNRLVHRAELVMEQVHDPNGSDTIFNTPEFLYLDAHDTTITASYYQYRTIPYDLELTTGGFDFRLFGCSPLSTIDGSGNSIKTWKFDVTRYVQHVLTKTQKLYDLRLSAPFGFVEQFGIPPGTDQFRTIFLNPAIAMGRVRLGGGNHPSQRMRLHIIYSKI